MVTLATGILGEQSRGKTSKTELSRISGEIVPSWAGTPDKFEEYHMRSQIYVNGVEVETATTGQQPYTSS